MFYHQHLFDNIDLVTKRLVELSIIQGSSDNISVIVVFLKDPHQISVDAWPSAKIPSPLDNMETAYDNNASNGASAFSNEDLFKKNNFQQDFPQHVNAKSSSTTDDGRLDEKINIINSVSETVETEQVKSSVAMDFIFGNPTSTNGNHGSGNDIDLSEVSSTDIAEEFNLLSNTDIVRVDCGPETDVDAVDESSQRNPLQAEHEQFFSDFTSPIKKFAPLADNAVDELTDTVIQEEIDNKLSGAFDDASVEITNEKIKHVTDDDNEYDVIQTSDIAKRISSIDFAEKKEYSFEREESEKEISVVHDIVDEEPTSPLADLSIEQSTGASEQPNAQSDQVSDDGTSCAQDSTSDGSMHLNLNVQTPEAPIVRVNEAKIEENPQLQYEGVSIDIANVADKSDVLTSADHVVVPESGEESEDEWNYINVKREETNNVSTLTNENLLEDNVETPIEEKSVEDLENSRESVNPFTDYSNVAESHASVQALVEPEEEYTEISNQPEVNSNQEFTNTDKPVDLNVNSLNSEIDEDMDFQLNPEAKEFVPTSPMRNSDVSSPSLGSGSAAPFIRNNLLDDDCLIAQSPRKGGIAMENIHVPSEHDFDDEIANRPMELEAAVAEIALLSPLASNTTGASVTDRPGSSESTYSYQEMNMKEAMHGDEKSIDEYATIDEGNQATPESVDLTPHLGSDIDVGNAPEYVVNNKNNPMTMSFYNDSGAITGVNPFSVDMNAVQLLPQEDDDEFEIEQAEEKNASAENTDALHQFDGEAGEHFVIRDTEFGMTVSSNDLSGAANVELSEEISPAEEDQNSNVHDLRSAQATYHELVDIAVEQKDNQEQSLEIECETADSTLESDKPEADLQLKSSNVDVSSIVQVVQEMASEVTSVLTGVQPSDAEELHVAPQSNIYVVSAEEINEMSKNVELNDTSVNDSQTTEQHHTSMDDLAESEQNYSALTNHSETQLKTSTNIDESMEELLQQTLRPVVGDVIDVESSTSDAASIADVVQKTDNDVTSAVEAAAERLILTGSATNTIASTVATTSATKKPLAKKFGEIEKSKVASSTVKKSLTASSTVTTARAPTRPIATASRLKGVALPTATTARTAVAAKLPTTANSMAKKVPAASVTARSTTVKKSATATSTSALVKTTTTTTVGSRTTASSTSKSASASTTRTTASSSITSATRTTSTVKSATTTSTSKSSVVGTKTSTVTRAPLSTRPATTATTTSPAAAARSKLLSATAASKTTTRSSPSKLSTNDGNKEAPTKLAPTARTTTTASRTNTVNLAAKKTVDVTKSPTVRQPVTKSATSTTVPLLTKRSVVGLSNPTKKPIASTRVSTQSVSPVKKLASSVKSNAPASKLKTVSNKTGVDTHLNGNRTDVTNIEQHEMAELNGNNKRTEESMDDSIMLAAEVSDSLPNAIIDPAAD